MRLKNILCIIPVLAAALPCTDPAAGTGGYGKNAPEYASLIEIADKDGYTEVSVRNPWDTAGLLHKYILIDRDSPVPAGIPAGSIIRTPVERAVTYSTIHAAIIEELGKSDKIVGICEPQYLTSAALKKAVREGSIADCGNSVSPNIERIISTQAEVLIATPFQNSSYGAAEKIGIPIIEGADYMERHPLGRAEWIRFFGLLFGCPEKADSIFRSTEKRYTGIRDSVSAAISAGKAARPLLMAEKRYGGLWGVAARNSYMAAMYRDAGACYPFGDIEGGGSAQMSFETILERCINADIWIFKYASDEPMTYNGLLAEYPLYAEFAPFTDRNIYACNTLGTDYYEVVAIHPEIILEDLVRIFHPGLLPEKGSAYFGPLSL